MDELTIGDKNYISSKRAAAITGYAKDYVGQLCREGHVEAKMVGRSWYVLESSIRAHRFGAPEENREAQKGGSENRGAEAGVAATSDDAGSISIISETWEASTYRSEEVPRMPEFMPSAGASEGHGAAKDMSENQQSLTEMQVAWKEWFENKAEPFPESSEVIETQEESRNEAAEPIEEATPVAVHRLPVARPVAVDIPVRQPVQSPTAPPTFVAPQQQRNPRSSTRRGANLTLIALMISIAGLAIAVGIIGSGFADSYLENNPILRYLGGTSSVNK